MKQLSEFGFPGLTLIFSIAIDKQKTLLSADVGHFSLVRAMHLADLITLMNGMYTLTTKTVAFGMLRSS
jgi:CDP-diacylglycerol--serine O-phosphatidyltransferase